MGCFVNHIADLIFSLIWTLGFMYWVLKVLVINKKYTTPLHLLVWILFLFKMLMALKILTCEISENYPWLEIYIEKIDIILDIFDVATNFGSFYFISIGLGYCDMFLRGFEALYLPAIYMPLYILEIAKFIFPLEVLPFYPLLGVYLALILNRIFTKTKNFLCEHTDLNYSAKRRRIDCCKGWICFYIFAFALNRSGEFFFLLFGKNEYLFDLAFRLLGYGICVNLLFVIRPNKYAGFTHDLLFDQNPINIEGVLQARVPMGYQCDYTNDSLVILPSEGLRLAVGIKIK